MGISLETLKSELNELNLRYQQLDAEALLLRFGGEHTNYDAMITIDGPSIVIRARSPLIVPQTRMPGMLDLVNRINASLMRVGAFWIHPSQHQIFYEYALLAPQEVSQEQIGWAMAAHHAMDRFYPAFAALIWGGLSPADALELALASGMASPANDESNEHDDEEFVV